MCPMVDRMIWLFIVLKIFILTFFPSVSFLLFHSFPMWFYLFSIIIVAYSVYLSKEWDKFTVGRSCAVPNSNFFKLPYRKDEPKTKTKFCLQYGRKSLNHTIGRFQCSVASILTYSRLLRIIRVYAWCI